MREFLILRTKGLMEIIEVWRGEDKKEAFKKLDEFGYGHTLVEVLERK